MAPPPIERSEADKKLIAVQSALTEAVAALLSSGTPGSFAQAMRLCTMGHKIELELVQSVKAAGPLMRTQYGGYVNGNALMGDEGFVGAPGYDIALPVQPQHMGPMVGDQTTLMRDLTMMLQSHFKGEVDRKTKQAEPTRYDVYLELNAKLTVQIEQLVDRVAQGDANDESKPSVVPAELLRGHPPRASLEPGNAFDPGGPVLHREDRGRDAPEGSAEDGDREVRVG
jgi:hypothetical protein